MSKGGWQRQISIRCRGAEASGFTLSLADRMSFRDRVVEALTVTSGSLRLSPLSFFAKYLSIDISDSRSRRTLDPGTGTRCDLR